MQDRHQAISVNKYKHRQAPNQLYLPLIPTTLSLAIAFLKATNIEIGEGQGGFFLGIYVGPTGEDLSNIGNVGRLSTILDCFW